MKNALSLENRTLKELGVIASAAKVPRWSRLKKTELLARLVALGSSAPTLAQALRIRDAKRLGVPCDALFSRPRDVETERPAPPKTSTRDPKKDASSASVPVSRSTKIFPNERKPLERRDAAKTPAPKSTSTPDLANSPNATPELKREPSRPKKRAALEPKSEPKSEPNVAKKSPEKRLLTPPETSTKGIPGETKRSGGKKAARTVAKPSKPLFDSLDVPTTTPKQRPSTPPSRVSTLKEKIRLRQTLGRETDKTDRLVLMVCDPYWLRACWEITPRLVERVRSAMGRHWHTSDPTLRLFKIVQEPQGATRREFVADVPVRGGVDNWYVDVDDPPSSFAVELGYLARDKQFFTLISSNVVETPQRSVRETLGSFGSPTEFGAFSQRAFPGATPGFSALRSASFAAADDSDSTETKFSGALERTYRSDGALTFPHEFRFDVDAEIVVKGIASPGVRIRVKEEPVRVKEDGTFSIRYRLPERRHVFPVVATSADGVETQTIILAVDRNTKILEPVFKEEEEE